MTIVAHVPNLFDRSRFQGKVIFVETPEEAVAHEPSLVIVDLDRCEDTPGFRLDGPRVIGFGPHADTTLHRRASEVGYDEIMVRSVFFRRLPDLLADLSSEDPPG